ncbi:sugar ABC transporter substrate-binding protein [Streptomyces viridochromogenes]|uniref:Sugar ABC transporter substrate-binding protein n=1 Tax=Streptomyces viridochromogenes TaxID=1938 RepID=A0A0J7Z1V9_STRVR|nr:multiple monosaccharide ABC transporter substrate-binding protein [Streptomyces viridochromogenes]KMS69729.1 sugar ABC transporter substrate-binding protein [Streptomyces viridochromogenes]KOG14915.1 sugar ABC transporter substrate-binding protein [Streptomyces viridochromogenes]KOG15145.1 sugar ABC transporter substrate-binding protein [Streptomyces viridochromogenes]
MFNRRTVLAGVASLGLTLSACSKGGAGGSGGSSEGGTVGVAMPTRSSERWLTDGRSVVEGLKAMGYKTKLVYGDDDPKAQVSQIEKLIQQGVDALIIAAIDNRSLNDVLQQAADADIPVVSYDRLILGTKNVDYYVSFDNEMVGMIQARYIIDKLGLDDGKGPFNIELFAGSPDDNNTKYFFDGSMTHLQSFLDSRQLVVRSGETKLNQITTPRWDGPTAQRRMSDILTKWYRSERVDAVLSPYDGISRGVLSALKSGGYGSGVEPLPVITGQDAELESVKSIIAGEQSQTVYKDVRLLAEAAATMVDDLLKDRVPWVDDAVGYNNGVKAVPAVLLQPAGVDKTNYETLVEDGYFTAGELK